MAMGAYNIDSSRDFLMTVDPAISLHTNEGFVDRVECIAA